MLWLKKISENGFQEVSNNGLLLSGLDMFTFQISIDTIKFDVLKKYSHLRKYKTMAFEKVSDNGLLLYDLDMFSFQISNHTLKLDVLNKYSHLRKYQTMAFCEIVYIFLDSKYLFIHFNWICQKSTPIAENIRQWPFVIWFRYL